MRWGCRLLGAFNFHLPKHWVTHRTERPVFGTRASGREGEQGSACSYPGAFPSRPALETLAPQLLSLYTEGKLGTPFFFPSSPLLKSA